MKSLLELGKPESKGVDVKLDVTHNDVTHNGHGKGFHGKELCIDALKD